MYLAGILQMNIMIGKQSFIVKKISFLIAGSLFSFFLSAQGPRRNGGQAPTGRFYGKVVDITNKGIQAASVTLIQKGTDTTTKQIKETIVGGMLTTASGDFSIENIPLTGKYFLKVTGIGYKLYEQPVAFQMPSRSGNNNDAGAAMGALDKDLGNIKLEIDEKILTNVTVTGTKPMMQMGIDRKIFNVEQNIVSAGGTALDVLKNVPTVSVDIDGNVSVRNSAPQIFVDGRPTNMTLEQIPADAIESIEVITNPSAKFDASGGTAGILNIVLKKAKRVGYSGNIRSNIDSRGKVGFGGNANIRQNKINFFVMGNYNQRKSIGNTITSRALTNSSGTLQTTQSDKNIMNGAFGFGRAGFDYFIDNRNTLTLSGSMARGNFRPTTEREINSLVNGKDSFNLRNSNGKNEFKNQGVQASFKHNFPKTGHEWTADITYNEGRNKNDNFINTRYYNMPGKVFLKDSAEIQSGNGNNDNLIIQTDYMNTLNDKAKLELGVRTALRKVNSLTSYTSVNPDGSLKVNQRINYNSQDHVYAAYANFSNRIKNFGYQLGLRLESSNYEGFLPDSKEEFNIDFPISFFPSVFLSQKLSDYDDLQFNYSRRINRPGFWQLFPFYDIGDPLNVSRGNAALKPEFTNSFELSYDKNFKNRDNFLASIYFKNTNDLITRTQSLEFVPALKTTQWVLSYINANTSYVSGLELISRNKIAKWWELTSNFNLFTSKIDLIDQEDPDQFLSYNAELNNNFKLPKNFSIQFSGEYDSKRLVVNGGGSNSGGGGGGRGGGFGGGGFGGGGNAAAQGFIRPQFDVDAAVRFDFLKDRAASLSLSVNDLFKTRKFDSHSEAPGFLQDVMRKRDQQIFRLNFNWRFGKYDASLFKRKNTRAENDQGIDAGPGF
jgi:outer membrane receptor protein involved in Fe transport